MSGYTPTIGLEIHAELKTRTKIFCNSKNDPDETNPNVNICPVCMAHPGTLPVLNRQAVEHVLRMGVALGGTLADYTEFDRKNYFYPDLPKGYQISQYQFPLVSGGVLNGVSITRIHLEEDTARSQHASTSQSAGTAGEWSVIDFNRAGIPLMELVTDPVIHDAKTASAFAEELQRLLRTIGAGEANMEKGQMRVEANISVSKGETLGTKVEVKNLNSFKSVERAIAFEIDRQVELIEQGGTIIRETRGWDEDKGVTFSQRKKEESHDYRYFPDPDIPKLRLSRIAEFQPENLLKSMPELPWQKRERLMSEGLKKEDAEILVNDEMYSALFASDIQPIKDNNVRIAAINLLLTEVRGRNPSHESMERLKGKIAPLMAMFTEGTLSSTGVKAVLGEVLASGGEPAAIAKEKGLVQMQDSAAILAIADKVISENAKVVEDVKAGKEAAMKFLIGQGMKLSKGSVHPGLLEKALKELLS